MDTELIKAIQAMHKRTKSHSAVKEAFNLNDAQEYAINIFGRDRNLSEALLAEHIDDVKNCTTIGEVAMTPGFPAKAAL